MKEITTNTPEGHDVPFENGADRGIISIGYSNSYPGTNPVAQAARETSSLKEAKGIQVRRHHRHYI
jgi:hypothetical protein